MSGTMRFDLQVCDGMGSRCYADMIPSDDGDFVEYADYKAELDRLRASLAGLPEELAERLRLLCSGSGISAYSYRPATLLEKEILAWHEQQKGEKE